MYCNIRETKGRQYKRRTGSEKRGYIKVGIRARVDKSTGEHRYHGCCWNQMCCLFLWTCDKRKSQSENHRHDDPDRVRGCKLVCHGLDYLVRNDDRLLMLRSIPPYIASTAARLELEQMYKQATTILNKSLNFPEGLSCMRIEMEDNHVMFAHPAHMQHCMR